MSTPTLGSPVRGAVHRWQQVYIPTLREAPADATTPSHALLLRAGYIRQLTAGVYDYLPLAWRVLRKVSAIIREELDAAGCSELLLPALQPMELFRKTGRAEAYGDDLFTLADRHDRATALGPTHEEVITDLLRGEVTSYKQLPLTLYQIQTKFRDEPRPRAGLLRGREFIMKDAYSFHVRVEGPGGLNETYDRLHAAYSAIFARCGLDFTVVEAEAGPIGGSASHEFMVNCESGEDTILRCPASGYAANVEKCEIGPRPAPARGYFAGEPSGALEEVHTPGCPGIDDVCKLLKVKPQHMLKSVLFKVQSTPEQLAKFGEEYILAVVRGDHEVNVGKVKALSECSDIALADPKDAVAKGFAIGFVSPRAAVGRKGVLVLVDRDAALGFDDAAGKPKFWVTGADKPDHHVKHFNWQRDLGKDPLAAGAAGEPAGGLRRSDQSLMVGDIRNALAGDPSPRAGGSALIAQRGIEVGHIFKLGEKYSKALGLDVMDEHQQRTPAIMGCYGIGVSRTMAACVEMSHDAAGIVWPTPLAPYHVLIVLMKQGDDRQEAAARRLAAELSARGVDVLLDDRDERPGVKFKDADLIGLPIRITLGDKALDEGCVEFKRRRDEGKGELVPIDSAAEACVAALG